MSMDEDTRNREEVNGLLGRFQSEHDLLVKRTAAILTLNGLMAASVAAGEKLPAFLKVLVAVVMIIINMAWLFRALATRSLIDDLFNEAYKPEYAAVLPIHAKIHKQRIEKRWRPWLNSANFFSMGIPIGLLVFWVGGLILVPMAGLSYTSARFQLIPAPPQSGEIYLFDPQTGDVWKREKTAIPSK